MSMVEEASDDQLAEIAEHLGYDADTKRPTVEPSFWHQGYLRLFISHINEHRPYAGTLQEKLSEYGISGFVAHKDIEPAKEWQDKILLALSTADTLVALLHEGFHASKWTDQEIGVAMGRSIPVVSVSLGEVPYGFIGRHQALNGVKKPESSLRWSWPESLGHTSRHAGEWPLRQ